MIFSAELSLYLLPRIYSLNKYYIASCVRLQKRYFPFSIDYITCDCKLSSVCLPVDTRSLLPGKTESPAASPDVTRALDWYCWFYQSTHRRCLSVVSGLIKSHDCSRRKGNEYILPEEITIPDWMQLKMQTPFMMLYANRGNAVVPQSQYRAPSLLVLLVIIIITIIRNYGITVKSEKGKTFQYYSCHLVVVFYLERLSMF